MEKLRNEALHWQITIEEGMDLKLKSKHTLHKIHVLLIAVEFANNISNNK